MENKSITLKDMWITLFRKEFYLDMAVFVFICMTSVFIVLYLILKLDRILGFEKFTAYPYNLILFIIFSILGFIIIWWAYTYLVLVGDGSPCPQLGGTKKLVTAGPYSFIRHPSVIGKLFGIVGLGCLSGSVTFTFILIPILMIWSSFYNRFIQEKVCVKRFGDEYLKYRKEVPMFIPKFKKILSLFIK